MSLFDKRYHPPGTSPGTLVGAAVAEGKIKIVLIDYSAGHLKEVASAELGDCLDSLGHPDRTWIHVTGRPDAELLTDLGEAFGLHPLALEDVLNSGQRPKAETYDNQLFVVMSEPRSTPDGMVVSQVSIFLGKNYVISFQNEEDDLFQPVRRRLRQPESRLRQKDVDYLFYALIDMVIDRKFPLLEELGERIEEVEDELLDRPSMASVSHIHQLKRDLLLLRRYLWPEREVVGRLLRDEDPLIGKDSRIYLRDCYDHAVQIMDLLETYREMVAGQMEVYLSAISNRLNEVMRVLTVISTIFIPLTFITSLYGMNFDPASGPFSMPELASPWGYPIVLGLMLGLGVLMVLWFRRKGWF
jgi:magnesium transporter